MSFAIFYKSSHVGFNVFKKAMIHDFRVNVNNQNFEGSIGLISPGEDWFIVSKNDKLAVFDC